MDQQIPDRDRRGYPRLPVSLKTRILWSGGELSGYTTDITSASVFVETGTPLAKGTRLRVSFRVDRDGTPMEVVADGKVVRVQDAARATTPYVPTGMAIRFTDFKQGFGEYKAYVRRMLDEFHHPAADVEKRAARRLPVGVPVYWSETYPPDKPGHLSNLSSSGCFVVETDETAEPGTRIYLGFDLPIGGETHRVRAVANVVRLAPGEAPSGHGMGIAFDMASMSVNEIEGFIREQCARADAWRDADSAFASGDDRT